jgi:hypothetical protein
MRDELFNCPRIHVLSGVEKHSVRYDNAIGLILIVGHRLEKPTRKARGNLNPNYTQILSLESLAAFNTNPTERRRLASKHASNE